MRTRSLLHSFQCAFAGVWYVLRTQRNARIHVALAAAVVALAAWLAVSPAQWAVLTLAIGLVFAAEMANTAAEALVDLATPQHHPLAKVAKDVAAGMVLVVSGAAAVVGVLVLGIPLYERLAG
ncbi:MAG: diacylglycerol kinase family protein [Planctomycetes bacterium]|nr:diacylglycerol kinase family protein [Planctomycetota bacterium]